MTPAVLILAAGRAARMGGIDKLTEPVDGAPLIRRQARAALACGVPVFVVLPPAPHPRHEALQDLPVIPLVLPGSAEGLSGSLRDGIAALPDEFTHALILLADLPEITADDLRAVLAGPETAPDALVWRGTTADGAPGHPILVARAIFPAFAALRGDDGGQAALKAVEGQVALIPLPGQRARRDLDTPEDWAAWRRETGR